MIECEKCIYYNYEQDMKLFGHPCNLYGQLKDNCKNYQEEKNSLIYCHINKINNKKYIGQCQGQPERRWRSDGSGYKPKNEELPTIFWKAILKYGWNNFEHIILETNLTLKEANEREQYWIAYYHTWIDDPQCWGYNMQSGGKNTLMSEEAKKKLRQAKLGTKASEETKQKLSEMRKGENNPFYGKHHSEEVKKKIGEKSKERWADEDYRNHQIEIRKGKKASEEAKKHMSEASTQKKKVRCIETNQIFDSIKQASEWCNIHSMGISAVCNHRGQKTAGGYHWEFV